MNSGRVILDPNDDLSETNKTPGVQVKNSATQSGGELVEIQGDTGETALSVKTGETKLDPNSNSGRALIVSNSTQQNGGELVSIEGNTGQTALKVLTGDVSFGGELEVMGVVTACSDLNVTGDVTVTGTTTLEDQLNVTSGGLSVSGDMTVTGNVTGELRMSNTTPPSSSGDNGTAGDLAYGIDAETGTPYLYICYATSPSQWARVALSTW